jgi:TRAP-type C4-dicarboxylate transport system permease small subunit
MKTLSYWINKLANGSNRVAIWGIVITGSAMSLVVFLQIIFRFVIYIPFPWSEECARYLMVWMGMLGTVAALRQGRHIGVTVLIQRLPIRYLRWLLIILQLVLAGFLAIIAKEGFALSMFNATQQSPAMEIPMFIPYVAIPVGAVLMILELCADVLHELFPTPAGSDRNMVSRVLL